MVQLFWAAYDPIFWPHHYMIDRLWWMWQNRHGIATTPEEIMEIELVPFGKKVREVLDINELGCEYAGSSANG